MRAPVRLLLCTAVLVAVVAPSEAQICAGRPAFNRGPIQLGLAPGVAGGEFQLGLSGGYGTDRLFGAGTFLLEPGDRPDDVRRWIGANIGTSQPLRLDNRLQLCPLAGVAWAAGAGASGAPRLRLSAGVMVGLLATNAARAAVVPTVGLIVHQDRSGSGSARTFARLIAGVGAVMTNGIAFGPALTIPLGDSPEAASVSAVLTVALPRR